MNLALILPDILLGSWINNLSQLTRAKTIDILVIPTPRQNVLDLIIGKLDYKIFGPSKTADLENETTRTIPVDVFQLDTLVKAYDTVISFVDKELFAIDVNTLCLSVCGHTNVWQSVVKHTLRKYESVTLDIVVSNTVKQRTTVRFDPLSCNRNIDITLHSFLQLLESYFTSKKELETTVKAVVPIHLPKDYFKYFSRFAKKIVHQLFYNDQWILAFNFTDSSELSLDINNAIKIIPPKDRFWADPIVVEAQGSYFVFIEELIYKQKIAHLSVLEIFNDGSYSTPVKILEKPYHLSYPFVFEDNGTYYMIPETANANNIQLYEATDFPYHWRFKKTLIDNIKASDTTLLKHDNKYWLFTSVKEYQYAMYDNNLSIYYTDDLLLGSWKSHKMNPIKRDVKNARPGGPIYKNKSSELIRVTQNASVRYGYGYNLNKIMILSEEEYKEEKFYAFTPASNSVRGVHTFNHINRKLKVIDVLMRKRKY